MAISWVSTGAAVTGNNVSLTPGTPAGSAVDDLYVAFLSARSQAASYATPAGWTLHPSFPTLHSGPQASKMWIFTLPVASAGQAVPAFTYSGGAAGESVLGQAVCFRGVDLTSPWRGTPSLFSSINTQNIGSIPGISCLAGNCVLVIAHKMDDFTSIATLTADTDAYIEIGEPKETTGNDAGMVWDYLLPTADRTLAARTFAVTGGGSNFSTATMLELQQYTGPPPDYIPARTLMGIGV